ncbi:hypothetical protein FGB62_30g343 [Gracilaria domingensis]|nr:hypothetical protein FGB62_30g343 [Gracilaria domingensis]
MALDFPSFVLDQYVLNKVTANDDDPESSSMCKSFYARLVRQTGLNVTDNVQKCSIIHKHVYSIVRAEKSEEHPISLVHSSSDGDQLCSDLITSAFMDMIPSPGVCFCPCDTGVALRGYVRRLKCNPSDREQYLKQLKNSFTLNASCDEDVAIHTVLVPVLISGNHWGVLVGKKYIVLATNALPSAVVSNKNYLLAVRGYKRQRDGFSCGCYVISMATEFAADTGFSPKATYKSGYKKMLSERIRWAAIKSRMLQVLSAAVFHGTDEVSESVLGSYRLLHRDHYSELRKDGLTRLKKMRHTILKRWDFVGISKVHSAQKSRDRNREVAKTSLLVGEACDLVKDVLSKENAGPECVSVDDGGSFEEHSVSDSEGGIGGSKEDEGDACEPETQVLESSVHVNDVMESTSSLTGSMSALSMTSIDGFQINAGRRLTSREVRAIVRARVEYENSLLPEMPVRLSTPRVRFETPIDFQLGKREIKPCMVQSLVVSLLEELLSEVIERSFKLDSRLSRNDVRGPGHYIGETKDVMDFVSSMEQRTGFQYTLHYFRYVRKRSKHDGRLLTARFRCPQHKNKCPSSIVVSLPTLDSNSWLVAVNSNHSHDPQMVDEATVQDRKTRMTDRMAKQFNAFRETVKGQRQSYWDTLYAKSFPPRPLGSVLNEGEVTVSHDGVVVQNGFPSSTGHFSTDRGPNIPMLFHIKAKKPVHGTSMPSTAETETLWTPCASVNSLQNDVGYIFDVSDVKQRNGAGPVHGQNGMGQIKFGSQGIPTVDTICKEGDSLIPAVLSTTDQGELPDREELQMFELPENGESEDASKLIERFLFLDENEELPNELVLFSKREETGDGSLSSILEPQSPTEEAQASALAAGQEKLDVNSVFKAAVIAYFKSLELNAAGQDVVKEVRYISECLGNRSGRQERRRQPRAQEVYLEMSQA